MVVVKITLGIWVEAYFYDLVFAMSKKEINFYDFAKYFKDLGCKNALYLDGFVSRTYLPEKNWKQEDGDFGVIIGVVK
jgi:uncharacterized protein YigE (DUF2233 family)